MSGIFTYISHKFKPNVGKYTSPMDPMGMGIARGFDQKPRIYSNLFDIFRSFGNPNGRSFKPSMCDEIAS